MTFPPARPAVFVRLALLALPMVLIGCASGGGGSTSTTTTTTTPPTTSATLTITAVSPTDVAVGSSDITLVVTGAGFSSSTVISLNTTAEPTTYVSSTEVHAAVAAAQLKTGAVLTVTAANGTTVVKADPAVAGLSVDNPVPSLTSVAPANVLVGSTAASVTVTGTNFVPGVALSVNGSPRNSTFVSATQLTADLTADDFVTAKSLPLNVINPKPGGGTSGTSAMTVNNPAPAITSLSPSSAVVGSAGLTMAITGSGILPSTVVQINNATRTSSYVSPTQVTVAITTAELATTGTLSVTLTNGQPGGGVSAASVFTIAAKATATPIITSVAPASIVVGSADTGITVLGTNFIATSKILWNGTPIPSAYTYTSVYNGTSYVYQYVLYGQVPASLLTSLGSATVTVTTPGAPADSNGKTVSIVNPPVPTITSLGTTAVPVGGTLDLAVYGSGFNAASYANFNGVQVSSTLVNSSQLTAHLTKAVLSQMGAASITVTTPAPGGGTSNALTLPVYAPLASNSMIYSPGSGLLWLSVPSSAGAPYGNSVVSMDPATGALGRPIPVGSEPNKLALTSDGKYLWVGLDGAYGVRKVDLTTNTAGLQFALNAGLNNYSATALALQALPGATDSVVVLQSSGSYSYYGTPAIYDSGTLRGTTPASNYYSYFGLQVDGSRNEIYVGGSGLQTFTYNASGLTAKTTNTNSNISLASSTLDDMQLASGTLIGNQGKIYDAEAGTLLGTLYQTGTTVAVGPTTYDATLGKIFVLDSSNTYCCSNYTQIQIFKGSDYTPTGDVIPFAVPYNLYDSTGLNTYLNPSRLTRWGSNGLAVRTAVGVFSLRSNLVKDLSTVAADLGMTATATGGTTTGTSTTYTFTVKNAGPSAAKDVALSLQTPSTGVFTGATTTAGTCSTQTAGCNLGDIANGATVTVAVTVLQTSAGTATATGSLIASSTDSNLADNTSSAAVTVAGSTYNLQPTLSSVTPSAVKSGSADTTITVLGTNFASGSTVALGTTSLSTTYVNAGKLTAVVPSANLASLGWSSVTVSSPAPGGGVSNGTPLTVYTVLSLGVNRMVYDPYSRKLMAAVSTGSSVTAGSSVVAITPETGTIGAAVTLTNIPTRLALSSSGQTLWLANATDGSLARYNMLTGTVDTATTTLSSGSSYYTPYVSDLAVQPGTENTLALGFGNYVYNFGVFDYSTSSKSFTERSSYSSNYYNGLTCMRFLDSSSLFFNNDSTTMYYFGVGSNGLTSTTASTTTLGKFNCFKISKGRAYAGFGGVAALTASGGVSQVGSFGLPTGYNYGNSTAGALSAEPDASLGTAFFAGTTTNTSYSYPDGVVSYDLATYLRTGAMSLNMSVTEGTSSFAAQDIFRWGQDGLAVSTSTGHIYLLRGPFVVPQLLNSNTPAVLTSSSSTSITHGTGNTLLTLTGSNFVPGIAVTWNGSYRTTTIVDATHVTVAIPASDLASAGSGALIATNPGAAASSTLTVTVQ